LNEEILSLFNTLLNRLEVFEKGVVFIKPFFWAE
jgi:hypothetical protein